MAGIMAGLACFAIPGLGLLAGLGLAMGTGFLGDWLGKEAGDLVFGPMDKNGHSSQWNAKQPSLDTQISEKPSSGRYVDYEITGLAGMSEQEFNRYAYKVIYG